MNTILVLVVLEFGPFNALIMLGFSKVWLLHRLNWTSKAIFKVYFDSRIERAYDLERVFAHLYGCCWCASPFCLVFNFLCTVDYSGEDSVGSREWL